MAVGLFLKALVVVALEFYLLMFTDERKETDDTICEWRASD